MFKTIVAAAVLSLVAHTSATAQTIRAITAETLSPFTRAADDALPGFNVEYMQAVAAAAGLDLEIEYMPWKRAQAVVAEQPDLLLFGATRNAAREEKYDWAVNLITAERVFLTVGASVDSYDAARSLGLIAARSVYYRALEGEGFTNVEEGDTVGNMKKLKVGRVDAVFTIAPRAVFNWVEELGYAPEDLTVGQAVGAGDIWLAASKGYDRDIMRRLEQANQTLRANGTYESIYRKYFGALPILSPAHPEKRPTAGSS